MNQNVRDFSDNYKNEVKKITEEYSSDPKQLQEKIRLLEARLAYILSMSKIPDEDKMELLPLFTRESAKHCVVERLESDENKVKLLGQFHDQSNLTDIIKTLADEDLRLESLRYITSGEGKSDVFVTLTDSKRILNFLENNPGMKKEVVQYLQIHMKHTPEELWGFMKTAGLEGQMIPYLLYSTKYQIVNSRHVNDSMRQDIEEYLGKPIPEDIKEMSEYEKIGVDLDALEGKVVTSSDQLGLDELQKMYMSSCYGGFGLPKNDGNKVKVPIRDLAGTFTPNLAYGIQTPKNWEELLCGLNRIEENIEHHSERRLFEPEINDCEEAIALNCINGKYYISGNGNHRMTLLKAKYLSEVKRANGDPKRLAQIDERYTIEASYVTHLPQNANELMGINTLAIISSLKPNEIKITEQIEDGRKVGYTLINGDRTSQVRTNEQLQEYLKQEIEQLKKADDGKLFEKFNEKVKSFNLDYPENAKYKKAFETMTGISLSPRDVEQEAKEEDTPSINECGEIIRNGKVAYKIPEEEKADSPKSEEESFGNGALQGDDKKQANNSKKDVNLWMNRFKTYNSAIDRVSQGVRDKFIKMKSDIINTIKEKMRQRNDKKLGEPKDER